MIVNITARTIKHKISTTWYVDCKSVVWDGPFIQMYGNNGEKQFIVDWYVGDDWFDHTCDRLP